jgi:hypothetical protein
MRPLATTPELQRVHALVRELVPYQPEDHRLDRDMASLAALASDGRLSRFLD